MASQVFKNAQFILGTVDLSANQQALSLNYEAESLDETPMGNSSRKMKGGLKNWSIDVTFFQNFACVDATVFALVGCQTSVEFRACNACSSAGNPNWEGTVMVQSYPPMGGSVGDLLMTQVHFEPVGDLRHCAAAS